MRGAVLLAQVAFLGHIGAAGAAGAAAAFAALANCGGQNALPGHNASRVATLLRRCAVVGSSDILRLRPMGARIDTHPFVFRTNNAPTHGHEREAGNRTHVRVVNHVPLEKWIALSEHGTAASEAARGAVDAPEFSERLCAPSAIENECLVSPVNGGPRLDATFSEYRRRFPADPVRPLPKAIANRARRCSRSLGGGEPSGGFVAFWAAAAVCAPPISLYGYYPHCCTARDGWPSMNYKYAHTSRTRWVCCSTGRERMDVEHDFYRRLHALGVVRLHDRPQLPSLPQ